MLFAERGGLFLALACSEPFAAMSCGYVGTTDGWQELYAHKRLINTYARAVNGNIALTGEIHLAGCDGGFTLALAFGSSANEAGQIARAALLRMLERLEDDHAGAFAEDESAAVSVEWSAGSLRVFVER